MTTFCRIPRDSSPGQRPFLARQLQFLDQLPRPPIEVVDGIQPCDQPQVLLDGQILEEMRLVRHEGQPALGGNRVGDDVVTVDRRRCRRSAAGCRRWHRSVVVLPAPFGPISPTISPLAAANDRSSTAVRTRAAGSGIGPRQMLDGKGHVL